MKLIEIEIQDFKSIKNLKWNLEESITCLVGQNESGKSNLIEVFDIIKKNQLGSLNHETHTNRSSNSYLIGEPPTIKVNYQIDQLTKNKIKSILKNYNIEERLISEINSLDAIIIRSTPDKKFGTFYFIMNGRERSPKEFITDEVQLSQFINQIRELETKIIQLSDDYSDSFTLPLNDVKSNSQPNSALMKLIKLSGGEVSAIPNEIRQIDSFLKQLSRKLNEVFTRKYYSQDTSVKLNIHHNSGLVYLDIEDNTEAVYSMNERSNGFKYYFSLLIEAATSFYGEGDFLFVLDEPGNSLHPSGQRDLLRYLEELSKVHRVIYSTHSPFLINRLFPNRVKIVERHKTKGTEFKLKGFSKNWKPLRTALGLNISDSFYYSEKVLIVEGPEDVLYLSSLLNFLVHNRIIEVNTEIFSFIDAGGESNLIPMVQIMLDEERPCVVLMDSDSQRTYNRLDNKQKSSQNGQLVVRQVNSFRKDAISIEDIIPYDLLAQSVNSYLEDLVNDGILKKRDNIIPFKLEKFENGTYKNLISTYIKTNFINNDVSDEIWKNEKVPISKVGIAKHYDKHLQNTSYSLISDQLKSSIRMMNELISMLRLKNQTDLT